MSNRAERTDGGRDDPGVPGQKSIEGQAFRDRSLRQWEQAAEGWHRWSPTVEEWLRPVTTAMVESAGISPGDRVLDLATGAGEPAVTIAKLVGKKGSVVAVDFSPGMVKFAEEHAREEETTEVTTRLMDGESLEFPDEWFDAAVSRLGLIYFQDRAQALRELRRVLRPMARASIAGNFNLPGNPFSAITMKVIGTRAKLSPPRPGSPGPFSLGDEQTLRGTLESAGFVDVKVKIVDAQLRMESAEDCARLQREAFGGVDQLLAALAPSEREEVWKEVVDQLRPLEQNGSFVSNAQFIVGSGMKPDGV
jgi:SAM-dependent methyltransferase